MEDVVNKYKQKLSKLEISVKKINALESHLAKKDDSIREEIGLSLKKIFAIKSMVQRTIDAKVDFSDMKENDINSKFLEIETLTKDIEVIFNKTISDVEKVVGKRLVIKNRKDS